jgi:hypothetical protein
MFLLSPASCSGQRAQLLLNESASFDLALQLRSATGAQLGQVFSFLSGLYFRGKLAYGTAFADPPPGMPGVLVITPCEGLRTPVESMSLGRLRRFAAVPIGATEERYTAPLFRDARLLNTALLGRDTEVVLLGSVASPKYLEPLATALGPRLRFPAEFVGRGDMSRGGLLLRCAADRTPLTHVPVEGSERHGPRPPRLAPRPGLLR